MGLPDVKTVADCDERLRLLRSERIKAIGHNSAPRVKFLTGEINKMLDERLKLTREATIMEAALEAVTDAAQ